MGGMTWARFMDYIMCTGPRLLMQGPRLLRRARKQATFDVEGCASVLSLLAKKDERLPFKTIEAAVPRGHDSKRVYKHLRALEGVIFLKSEPKGLSLTSTFRKELRDLQPEE
jgi:hypothetical protein